jgi:FkbM family methyltransferase
MNDELPEQILITKYLTGDEKVLEIGSNVGRSSLVISSILREPHNLVTLECDLYTSEQLIEHRDINNRTFHIEASALSKRKIIQKDWDTLCSDVLLDGYQWVSTITMDELNTKYRIEFDTLVLDCEGAFCNILRDMPEVLDNIKLIIMENDYKTRADYDYVHKTLVKHGFYVDFIEHGGGGPCYMNFYEVWKRVMA